MTRSPAANAFVGSGTCPLCEHVNPPASKFCNACGAPIHLVRCGRCGAINDPAATNLTICQQCAAPLSERRPHGLVRSSSVGEASEAAESGVQTPKLGTPPIAQPSLDADEFDRDAVLARLEHLRELLAHTDPDALAIVGGPASGTASPASASSAAGEKGPASPPLRARLAGGSWANRIGRRGLAVIVGAVAVAILAAAGYYGYRERPARDVPQGPAARGTVKNGGSVTATGVPVDPSGSAPHGVPRVSTPPVAALPPVATDPKPIAPAPDSIATTRGSQTVAPGDAPSPATAPVAGSSIGTTTVARPRSADAAPGVLERRPPHVGPCTDGVAALGLCTPQAIQQRQ